MGTTKHSSIGASSMERWSKCPGSVRLSEGMENKSSSYAEEGTLAHEYAADALNGKMPPDNLDIEMANAVDVYRENVLGIWNNLNHVDDKMLVEHSFDISSIYPGLYGTADCVIYDGKNKILHVIDFKYGAGIAVSPKENPQLLYYGIGALMTLNFPIKEVELHIIQPRCAMDEPVKSWRASAMQIMEFAADLKMYAKATEDKNAALVPGDQCRWCNAKIKCPALNKQAQDIARQQFSVETIPDSLRGMTPELMAENLNKIDILETWIKAVREYSFQAALEGRLPTGYKLVPKRATRKWIDVPTAISAFNTEINGNVVRELMTDPELKSPAQVEKVLGKSGTALLERLTVKISSGDTLVPISDARQEVKRDAKSEFAISNLLS